MIDNGKELFMAEVKITVANFENEVMNSDKPVLLDFYADWFDVLATAIRAGMPATELTELDLAYAPPYSSAKDPVNMAGYMIENLDSGKVRQFHWIICGNIWRNWIEASLSM